MPEELTLLSAAEIRGRIERRELSPVEVVEASLRAVERYGAAVNAVVTLNERAVDEARDLERRIAGSEPCGLLVGLPVGIKDVTPVAGLRTTYGSPLYADHVSKEDALVVRRLRDAGAIVLGKTNTPEFAAGGTTFNEVFGRTRNPWNPARSPGGSTGGGAAALATGMIALAEGTDLGGSLRIPASFCGVVGLRPSPGLVPTWPTPWPWDDLEVTGPMARTAEDVALMLQAVAGPSPLSPRSQPLAGRDFVAAVREARLAGLHLAYCPDVARIGVDPGVEAVCREAAFALEAGGARVEEIGLDLSYGREAFLALRGLWMMVHQFERLERTDELGPNVAANVALGREISTERLAAAEHARARIWEELRSVFERYDLLLTPCMAVPPGPAEESYPTVIAGRPMETYVDWIAPTFVFSLAGLPTGSVPAGRDPDGLPVGLQVVGPPRGEESVLALMHGVQQARPIGRPDLAALAAG
ncbi:MAG: amidase [Gemmatimonadota bacterium]